MRTTRFTFIGLATVVGLAAGCDRSDTDDKSDDDIDITDYGDFDDGGDDSDGGSGSDAADDGGSEGGLDEGGSEGGSASGTGGSTGADDGGEGDGDDGGDDGPDGESGGGSGSTEPPVPPYAPSDAACDDTLVYEVQMLDAALGSCVECTSGVDHWVAALIYNPCDTDLTVTLYDGYVIGSLELTNHTTGEGMGMGSGSTGLVVTETIGAGEWRSEEMWMGVLSDGEYSVSVGFFDEGRSTASLDFVVD